MFLHFYPRRPTSFRRQLATKQWQLKNKKQNNWQLKKRWSSGFVAEVARPTCIRQLFAPGIELFFTLSVRPQLKIAIPNPSQQLVVR